MNDVAANRCRKLCTDLHGAGSQGRVGSDGVCRCSDGGAKIVVYGGTFRPPPLGHVACVSELKRQGYTVVVVPSAGHEFKPESRATYARRRELAQLAFGEDANAIEDYIDLEDPRRAFLVMRHVRDSAPSRVSVSFAIGPDIDPTTWTGHAEILAEGFGFHVLPSFAAGVRSTDIRAMIARGDPRWSQYVPESTIAFILNNPDLFA